MSDILGHDCDGKPLRAGDRVVIVPPAIPVYVGTHCLIVREASPGKLLTDHRNPATGNFCFGPAACFRKIADDDALSDWSTVCLETGWYPGKPVRQPEAA